MKRGAKMSPAASHRAAEPLLVVMDDTPLSQGEGRAVVGEEGLTRDRERALC